MEIKKNFYEILSYILLGIILSPIIYIFLNVFNPSTEISTQIFNAVIKEYLLNTILILLPTLFFTFLIGVSLAYFETFYDFKFKKIFNYIILSSFAIPSYLFAFIYVDLLTTPLYIFLKKRNINLYLDIANIKGAIFVFTLAFFPYVYISTKASMKKTSMNLIYSSKLLGKSNFETLINIILPLSKKTIIASLMIVFMETINAFGVPSFFGIRVFSTAIYEAWINYYDINLAIKLSSILVLFVLVIILLEQKINSKSIYDYGKYVSIRQEKLSGLKEVLVVIYFSIISLLSFVMPMLYMLRWLYLSKDSINYIYILEYTKLTIYILLSSSFIILLLAIFLNNINILKKEKNLTFNKLVSIGYSIPGSVISIGFLSLFIAIDLFLIKYKYIDSMLLVNSPVIIIFAYTTRFLSIAYAPIEASIKKTGSIYHQSSRILGYTHLKTFFKVDIFMQKTAILSSFLLLGIEIIKEMPIAALLIGRNTLAIKIRNYASDEELSLIALPALILVSLALMMIIMYNYIEKKGEN